MIPVFASNGALNKTEEAAALSPSIYVFQGSKRETCFPKVLSISLGIFLHYTHGSLVNHKFWLAHLNGKKCRWLTNYNNNNN